MGANLQQVSGKNWVLKSGNTDDFIFITALKNLVHIR